MLCPKALAEELYIFGSHSHQYNTHFAEAVGQWLAYGTVRGIPVNGANVDSTSSQDRVKGLFSIFPPLAQAHQHLPTYN